MTYPTGYEPHDPGVTEWTCMRCGAVVAHDGLTELHTLFHDAIDAAVPVIDKLATTVALLSGVDQ